MPNTLNLSICGINTKELVNQLSDRLAFTSVSACHEDTKHQSMSITLEAIGLEWELARGTVQLSTSYMTTDDK